ncbi:MAG: transketolase [Clostridiales bacterium]|nr:transketolase [Clostridiales bacterium]
MRWIYDEFKEELIVDEKRIIELSIIANKVRKAALTGIYNSQSGHPGGSLSIADVLTLLYFEVMNVDPKNPKDPNRDRMVLSKGHTAPALYATLAQKGYFPVEDVYTLRRTDSYMQGHPDMNKIPGVDMSTGSLGQGVSAAGGMALAAKLDNKDYRVYSILGDGELEEGQVWEQAMFAPHYKLDNLTIFVDNNGLQIDGDITKVMNPTPIDEKFKAFGWNVIVTDAHDFNKLLDAVNQAKATKGKPTAIIMQSVKGKNVSYMENNPAWHGAAPKEEDFNKAISELDAQIKELEARL